MGVEVAVDLEEGSQNSIVFADGLDTLHFLFLSTYIIPILPSENDNEEDKRTTIPKLLKITGTWLWSC